MLSESILLTAAIEIMLRLDHQVALQTGPDGIAIRLPTTRRLADYLGVPHYYVLPHFAEMEKNNLIQRKERVGISTTPRGTRMLLSQMRDDYAAEANVVLGDDLFALLQRRALISSPDDRMS
ncbi:MAG: hypothetical protein APR53_06705 [Methanoculleus sp. SDB]|nr:MAG: hypothetical protein APR53_06705 [Methanoculleus sp. SDB]